jgi:hypothetical protein
MATYGHTFTSGDTLTPTKLNAARTVTEIVNADINASAAIAGTKIDPDFGAQAVDTTGNVTANRLVAGGWHRPRPLRSPSRVMATRAFFIRSQTR